MKNLYVNSLHARDIGLFREANICFNSKFNFIVGPNGCGKTSILRCFAIALSPSSAMDFRYKNESELWIDFTFDNNPYRVGIGKGWVAEGESYRKAKHSNWVNPPAEEGRRSVTADTLNKENINFAPLILGAYRRISYKEIQGMVKEKDAKQKRNIYRSNSSSSIDGGFLPEVKQWMINRYFEIEKSWAKNLIVNWEWLIENFKYLGPKNSGFQFKEIKEDLEPVFELYNKECYLEELSAGFQAILSLVLSIFEWIESTNTDENIIVENAVGTVIIDELDVHLHPEWQLTIREALEKIFPNLQFIVTTHSPHLIASAKSNELIILPEHEGVINVKPSERMYSGWNTDQILEEVMGVKSLENKVYSQLIHKAMNCIEKRNIDELKKTVSELEKVVHPSDTIVSIFRIKIASLELGE